MSETTAPQRKRPTRRLWAALGLILLLAALCASLAGNFLTYKQAIREYKEMKQVRLDPMGLHDSRFPAEVPADAGSDDPLVVFFGDSRAQGWWPPPAVKGWRFANRGIYGQSTAQIAARLDAQVLPLKPRVIVIQAGINDLTAIGVFPEKRDEIVDHCKRNLRDIISRAHAAGATVIVTAIFPVGPVPLMKRPLWSSRIPDAVQEVNADLQSINDPDVILLDTFDLLQDQGSLRRVYALDTLHLNSKGYAVLNERLRQILSSSEIPKPR